MLRTNVSKCYWCRIAQGVAEFKPAELGLGGESPAEKSWFDELFKGGIKIQEDKPTTLLLKGPPGSGKTTLALEMCYRLAQDSDLFTLYISTDSDTEQIIGNARDLGWADVDTRVLPFEEKAPDVRAVAVWGADKIKEWQNLTEMVELAIDALATWFKKLPKGILERLGRIVSFNNVENTVEKVLPDILVVDSLNILEREERGKVFQDFLRTARDTKTPTQLLVFVMDSSDQTNESDFWEYVCDTVIDIRYSHERGYYTRTLEIVKARYQEHVWGKHQLKIYPRYRYPDKSDADYNTKLRRSHPYRQEGGIAIFPSIHYYLSVCKREAPTRAPEQDETLLPQLNTLLSATEGGAKGLPRGRCTAFVGARGGHKSHLAYLHLLHRIAKYDEKALVISLRDDEEMTKQTMNRIVEQQSIQLSDLNVLEHSNQLEILYFPPGYITPEEFIHRIIMSIHRLKGKHGRLTVLFNSLDQLRARFPLCAKEEIFVPGLIEILIADKITSIFIAVQGGVQPEGQYGLLAMADLILSFNLYRMSFSDYFGHLTSVADFPKDNEEFNRRVDRIKGQFGETEREEVVMRVERFAGGQRAGAKGILELVDDDKKRLADSLYQRPGLHLTPLNPKSSYGEVVT